MGGIVARVRPEWEPEPQEARNQLLAWCAAQGKSVPDVSGRGPYEGGPEGSPPLVADDAEVSIIAAHLTRLVTDVLVRPGSTAFPSPAYVLGMRAGWIFDAPFEAWPVMFRDEGAWNRPADAVGGDEALAVLRELFPMVADDDD